MIPMYWTEGARPTAGIPKRLERRASWGAYTSDRIGYRRHRALAWWRNFGDSRRPLKPTELKKGGTR